MTEEKKKGLLVEDKTAVEVTDGKGGDKIVRTNNREETVKGLKKGEGPKPLHD